jgi:hypothetical protein
MPQQASEQNALSVRAFLPVHHENGALAMCTRIQDLADGILDVADGHMRAAQAKWSRLTSGDLSGIRNKQDLITSVRERYSLSHAAATRDVELWDACILGKNATSQRPLSSTRAGT